MKWSSYLANYALYSNVAKKMDNAYWETSYDELLESNSEVVYTSFEDNLIERLSKEGY